MSTDSKSSPSPFRYGDHPRPKSRRDLLAQGFMGYAAMAFLPSQFGFGRVLAQDSECPGNSDPGGVSFLVFDMAGGAALPGNFLVGGPGGPLDDLLPSYDLLGWNPRTPGTVAEEFGLPMYNVSGLYAGIVETASAAARANLRLGSFCHFAQDDTRSNPLSAVNLASRAGVVGQYISKGLGLRSSNSGGNSVAAFADESLKPVLVSQVGDVQGAVSMGGETLADLTQDQMRALATGARDISRETWQQLLSRPQGDELKRLAECSYEKNLTLLDGVSGVDPREDAIFQGIYNINTASAGSDPQVVAATLALNSLRGFSGPAVWTLGGCDYHDGTATSGDAKDLEMGRTIGRAVEAAQQLGRPMFFQLLTDGGCDNRRGSREWTGDSGIKCMTVIGYFNPNGPPEYRRSHAQVGHYTTGQGADRSTLIGTQPQRVAAAVFANYLNIVGRLGEIDSLIPGDPVFTPEELESVLIFAGA